MAVRIVTDSASDIPSELAQELGVVVVPCTVSFGTEVFRDGVDITKDEFFERLTTSKVMPTTAQPSVSDFIEAYKPLVDQGDEIVSVHVSGKLSGTLNSARLAMQEFANAKIETVDSLQASMGVVLAVKAAAEAAQAGADMEAVVAVAQDAVSKIDTYFALDTLEYLQKGGRIGKAQALMGSLLSVKPVLTIADGEVHPFEKVRTRAKAIQRMKDLATEGAPYADLALIHRSSEADVADMAAHLAQFTSKPLTIGSVGASIGAHTGPGMIALALRKA